MTTKELRTFFKEHLVPSKLYHLGDKARTGRICIGKDDNGFWQVYFSEKKNKIGLMNFATESEACQRMKEEVCKVMEQLYGVTWRGLA